MNPTSRLDLVDALRGFALVSIMLLHNIEHFDLYHVPAGLPAWLATLDKFIWDAGFFLFGGKSYAIFAMLFGVTFWLQFSRSAPEWGLALAVQRPLETIVASWTSFAFMLVLVAAFSLGYQRRLGARLLSAFIPLGRMSLTSYLVQSVVGTMLYYGWGFGLYQYTGATVCLLTGIALAVIQGMFSAWWLHHHAQGPLEALWHRLTWLRTQPPARKKAGVM